MIDEISGTDEKVSYFVTEKNSVDFSPMVYYDWEAARNYIVDHAYNYNYDKYPDLSNFSNSLSDCANFVDTTLNMSELSSQFYDEETNTYVYNLKNFNIGDHIQFEDVILDIYYDEDRNATIIVFKDFDQDNVSWAFNGDFEKEYSIGDTLKFSLTVVEEYSDDNYTFETISYIKEGLEMLDKNIYPSIDKYFD